ncbi:MAG: ABC transporter permease [Phormidesmis sp.]
MSYAKKRYLKPSVFWSIRQGFPGWLRPVLTLMALAIPLVGWSILSYGEYVSEAFLPTPSAVLAAGWAMLQDGSLMTDILASSGRVMAGFGLAALVGVPIGIAMGTFYSMESLFGGFVGTVRYMPIAAFTPLMIIWAGIDELPKVLIIFLGIVFYNAIMVADSVKFIPNETLDVAYTLGATRRDVLFRVILPATLPSIVDTLRVNVAGAWNFLVISELLAAESGLGYTIMRSQRTLQTDKVLFCILVIGCIGLITDFLFKLVFRLWLPWAEPTAS